MRILILAGGSGTRLWPLSRKNYPKQFLPLLSQHSLIQETAARVKEYPVHVITSQDTDFLVADHLSRIIPGFSVKNVFGEPCARNTAPAIAYAASFFPDEEILAVLPSDHTIAQGERFRSLLKEAEALAKKGKIVTFGIVPHRPETGYGYIKTLKEKEEKAFLVDSFKEKPNLATAQSYLKEGGYYWNSGMFVFSVKTLKEEMSKTCPEVFQIMQKLAGKKVTLEEYRSFPEISIDYAVMEKTKQLVLLEADMGWNDMGGFEAIWESLSRDLSGNAVKGKVQLETLEAKNNLVFSMASDQRIIALMGVEDLIVADTDDALLVCTKEQSQNVKKIFETLKSSGKEEVIFHTKVFRPWGYYVNVREEKGFKIKEIVVYPGQRLSLQSHNRRSESWTVVEGQAVVTVGDQDKNLAAGENILIPLKAKHRLANPSHEQLLKIVEVQMGDYLGEDDIIRYQDDYNRIS